VDEPGGRPIDEVLTDELGRLVERSGVVAPPLGVLEDRVVERAARRQRTQRRVALAACAAVLAALGLLGLVLAQGSAPDEVDLATDAEATTLPIDVDAAPVFTIAGVPDDLAFQSCTSITSGDQSDPAGVTCTFDEPSTMPPDGVRISRLIGGATPEAVAAWDASDGAAAALATGGSDAPADAAFRTLGSTRVLDLAPGGSPSTEASAALRVLVGDDLVDLGASNVALDDLAAIVDGLSMAPPSTVVADALGALPDGSVALVQGERPLWVQVDALQPDDRRRFGGTTVGAEIAVPGSPRLIGVDVTTGIDADAFLDELLASGDDALVEAELGGRRAVVLADEGMMPRSVPEPRAGPQIVVRSDPTTIVRVKDPDGSPELIRAVAEALR
jgi:hypothetical protein